VFSHGKASGSPFKKNFILETRFLYVVQADFELLGMLCDPFASAS
jgi:hypothetical protein